MLQHTTIAIRNDEIIAAITDSSRRFSASYTSSRLSLTKLRCLAVIHGSRLSRSGVSNPTCWRVKPGLTECFNLTESLIPNLEHCACTVKLLQGDAKYQREVWKMEDLPGIVPSCVESTGLTQSCHIAKVLDFEKRNPCSNIRGDPNAG